MDIKVTHSCPSCGAPIELTEASRLSGCVFCGVQNYLVQTDLLRFVLPHNIPESVAREDIIYFPYLRFKGNIHTCQGTNIHSKVLDTTYQGIDDRLVAPSLGLRPQAMKVSLVDETITGRFLKRKETKMTIFQRAALMSQAFSDAGNEPPHHRAFIGETISCLYLPLYIEDGRVFDGVLNDPLGKAEAWLSDENNWLRYKPEWKPAFLATICPQCGSAMEGERDSLVMYCYNCESCCTEKNGKFVPVPYRLVYTEDKNVVYLPFWRILVEGKGITLRTMADLLTVANQPIVVNQDHQDKKLEFWIPALKLRPKIFLALAKNATLSQLKFPEGDRKMARPIYPVTLPLSEALQAMKSIVAETTVHRKEVMPRLPKLTFSVNQTSLTFLPFEDTGHDLVQIQSALSVASSVVRSGRKL